jgi:hypothetical protein
VFANELCKLFDLLASLVATISHDNNRGRVDAKPFQLSEKT